MDVNGLIFNDSFVIVQKNYLYFSGTVKVDGVAAVRKILIYPQKAPGTFYTTESDSSGNWSKEVPGGSYDMFRVICIGKLGENSQIFEHIME